LLAEFKRAVAADRRHGELRYMDRAGLAREGVTRADVPRRVFEEYYQNDTSCSPAHRASRRERNRPDYRRKVQQQIAALAWRGGPVAAS
jgi:hypothetical protein